jgi:BolA protein
MTPTERKAAIYSLLDTAFAPTELAIIDDSHLHVGHPGSQGGGSHFHVKIKAGKLIGRTRVQQHQLIYQALGDLIPKEVHALRITVIAS